MPPNSTIPFPDVPPPNPGASEPATPGPSQPPIINQVPGTLGNLLPSNLLAWGMTVVDECDMGIGFAPVAAPFNSQLVEFWRKHTGVTIRMISCVGIAGGTIPPQMPSPTVFQTQSVNWDQPNNPAAGGTGDESYNEKLVWWKLARFVPDDFMDGVRCAGAVAVYIYALQASPVLGVDSFAMGASPFNTMPATDVILKPANFYEYLNQSADVAAFAALGGGQITF